MQTSATERKKLGHQRSGWLDCSSSVLLAEVDVPSRHGATAISKKDKEEARSNRSSGGASYDPPTLSIPGAVAAVLGIPISAKERQNLSHRRFKEPLGCSSSVRLAEILPSAMAKDKEEIRRQLRSKRSSGGTSSDPTWIILNRVGARKDFFHGDHTTSMISHTSSGKEISVSFRIVEPPGTSLLTLDWPQGPNPMKSTHSYPKVVAADLNSVLFEVTSGSRYPYSLDYFVYRTCSDRTKPPSLSKLPGCYEQGTRSAGRSRQRIMSKRSTGLLCCSTGSLLVAELETRSDSPSVNIYVLWTQVNRNWQVFKCLPVCSSEHTDLFWWSIDAVVPFRSCYLVWVDYYKGMIIGKMNKCYLDQNKPELRYVSLPVDPIRGNPDSLEYGRGCPEASRSLCVAGNCLKFVIVNQHNSSFSITLWSMSDDYMWREEATIDAGQLWALDSKNKLPHVQPEFPVVNMKNPEAVCLLLSSGRHSADSSATTWIIEVHMKERRLLDAIYYCKEVSLADQNKYMTARMMSEGCSFISSELPCYLPDQAMKSQLPEQAMKRKSTKREYA